MATGSGTGTPIVFETPGPGVYEQYEELTAFENCAVSLPRYAKLIGYDECAFWGVSYEGQSRVLCSEFWTEFERQTIANSLAEAQQEIEQVVGYPLCPRWIVGTLDEEPNGNDRWVDSQPYYGKQITRYSHVIEAGVRAVATVALSTVINHATDPAIVGPLATTVTEPSEIKVYYPGSARAIEPSSVTIAGGFVTIRIPRCRLVLPSLFADEEAILYENGDSFQGQVDVMREYNDPSTQAVLVRPGCSNNGCVGGCSDCTTAACMTLDAPLTGIVDVRPATYTNGVWRAVAACQRYTNVRLNYRAGLLKLNLQAEMAIVRLAHAKSPEAPCSCGHTKHLWERDRVVPEILTRERLNCPFGVEQGAWTAYTWAKTLRQVRSGVL